jgi:hypothetical protein
LIRSTAWRDLGGFDETIAYGEDADFVMRLALAGSLDACDDVLTYIVRNPTSVTRRRVPPEDVPNDVMAKLTFCEKWLLRDPESKPFAASYAAWEIIRAIALCPPMALKLPEQRARMTKETPNIAALIARSNRMLALNLLVYGSRRSHRFPAALGRVLSRVWPRFLTQSPPGGPAPILVADTSKPASQPSRAP